MKSLTVIYDEETKKISTHGDLPINMAIKVLVDYLTLNLTKYMKKETSVGGKEEEKQQ